MRRSRARHAKRGNSQTRPRAASVRAPYSATGREPAGFGSVLQGLLGDRA
ncbi:hypothetical protein ACH4TC_34540 [Streptomyces spororaveus]